MVDHAPRGDHDSEQIFEALASSSDRYGRIVQDLIRAGAGGDGGIAAPFTVPDTIRPGAGGV